MKIRLGRKVIGDIENGVFSKTVIREKHLFHSVGEHGAWGIDAECFNNRILKECKTIEVFDKQTKSTYKVDVDTFNDKSKYLHFKPFRPQRFLKLEDWQEIKK